MKRITKITKINAIVNNKSLTASFLFPFKYHMIGLPKTSIPISATEKTSKVNINIGARNVSGWLEKLISKKLKKDPIKNI